MRAAAIMRGENVPPTFLRNTSIPRISVRSISEGILPQGWQYQTAAAAGHHPRKMKKLVEVGKSSIKVDGVKLATGKPAFTDDVHPEGMLYGALLTSPHAHANIKDIDTSKAKALPGVRSSHHL